MAISKDTLITEISIKESAETQKQINEYQKHVNQLTQENRKLNTGSVVVKLQQKITVIIKYKIHSKVQCLLLVFYLLLLFKYAKTS
ncbi:MAG: hypothetical protein LBB53_04970 [Prevotellaceae bacterium]|jgi:hypothetical protein|nr:hypothetical protein [Prevotellaceae bacterium]